MRITRFFNRTSRSPVHFLNVVGGATVGPAPCEDEDCAKADGVATAMPVRQTYRTDLEILAGHIVSPMYSATGHCPRQFQDEGDERGMRTRRAFQ